MSPVSNQNTYYDTKFSVILDKLDIHGGEVSMRHSTHAVHVHTKFKFQTIRFTGTIFSV